MTPRDLHDDVQRALWDADLSLDDRGLIALLEGMPPQGVALPAFLLVPMLVQTVASIRVAWAAPALAEAMRLRRQSAALILAGRPVPSALSRAADAAYLRLSPIQASEYLRVLRAEGE